jgi:hypothetical protein
MINKQMLDDIADQISRRLPQLNALDRMFPTASKDWYNKVSANWIWLRVRNLMRKYVRCNVLRPKLRSSKPSSMSWNPASNLE